MRRAALPDFRKLYRRITQGDYAEGLPAGNYSLTVHYSILHLKVKIYSRHYLGINIRIIIFYSFIQSSKVSRILSKPRHGYSQEVFRYLQSLDLVRYGFSPVSQMSFDRVCDPGKQVLQVGCGFQLILSRMQKKQRVFFLNMHYVPMQIIEKA